MLGHEGAPLVRDRLKEEPLAVDRGYEDVRALLRELSIQVPAREVNAPPFSLSDTGGAPVRLADYKGRAVMIYFWTTY
jgi:hypothetical protein